MVKTTTSNIEVNEIGFIINTFKTRSALKPVYILEQANTISQITNGVKGPMMINFGNVTDFGLKQMMNVVDQKNLDVAICIAVLMESEFKKKAFNFMMKFRSPICPVVAFTDIEDANQWLRSFI